MFSKMLRPRHNSRPNVRIIVDDSVMVRDAMTAHLMAAPKMPRTF